MFAFKILNLRDYSERIISVLICLSLGLISLIFASARHLSVPIPHLPFPVTVLILSLNYACYGDTFFRLHRRHKKDNRFTAVVLFCIFTAALFLPAAVMKFNLFFISFLLSALSVYLFILLYKKASFGKALLFNMLFHFAVNIYMLYLSLSFFY